MRYSVLLYCPSLSPRYNNVFYLKSGVTILRRILLHTRRGRSRGWAFRGTGSSNIWCMPISQTVLMRSASDYRSSSLVHGRKSVISKFDPPWKNFRGQMGVRSWGHQIRTRGVYTPSREEFSPSTPKDLRHIWKLRKKWLATVVRVGGTCTHTHKCHCRWGKWGTLG